MTARIAAGPDRAILEAVLTSLSDGVACIVPPPDAILGVADIAERVSSHHVVVYTSGSTGSRRGILRTFESWSATFGPLTELTRLTRDDVVWIPGPLTSTLYLYGAVHASHVGATVLLSDMAGATATVVHAVPAVAAHILDHIAEFPHLRLLVVAGDRVAPSLYRAADSAGIFLLEYYGAAELSFVAVRAADGALRPFPGVEIEVREGVIWARSPYVASGYIYADTDVADGPMQSVDGWVSVGDLGSYTDGVLTVRGRGDSGVTVGGHTVVTADVEHALQGALGTHDVAVTGVTHPRFGSVIVGVIAADCDDAALRRATDLLPAPARPRRWIRIPQLPRTPAGKIDRRAIRTLAESA